MREREKDTPSERQVEISHCSFLCFALRLASSSVSLFLSLSHSVWVCELLLLNRFILAWCVCVWWWLFNHHHGQRNDGALQMQSKSTQTPTHTSIRTHAAILIWFQSCLKHEPVSVHTAVKNSTKLVFTCSLSPSSQQHWHSVLTNRTMLPYWINRRVCVYRYTYHHEFASTGV